MKSLLIIICNLFILSFLVTAQTRHSGKQPQGTLFIIGGGAISDSMRQQILKEARWKTGDLIAAVTLASSWDSAYISMNAAFRKITGEDCIQVDSVSIHNPLTLDSLKKARLIYLGGGDQERFMKRIQGTEVAAIIKNAYQKGALIAGTSAGASVMSQLMLTGNSTRDSSYAATFSNITEGNLEIKQGLGLLDSVIIDQHFIVRSRYNRMLTAVMDYPGYQCIGINESTAIIVRNKRARVTGESQVIVFSHPKKVRKKNGYLGAQSISLSVFLPGDQFAILQ